MREEDTPPLSVLEAADVELDAPGPGGRLGGGGRGGEVDDEDVDEPAVEGDGVELAVALGASEFEGDAGRGVVHEAVADRLAPLVGVVLGLADTNEDLVAVLGVEDLDLEDEAACAGGAWQRRGRPWRSERGCRDRRRSLCRSRRGSGGGRS